MTFVELAKTNLIAQLCFSCAMCGSALMFAWRNCLHGATYHIAAVSEWEDDFFYFLSMDIHIVRTERGERRERERERERVRTPTLTEVYVWGIYSRAGGWRLEGGGWMRALYPTDHPVSLMSRHTPSSPIYPTDSLPCEFPSCPLTPLLPYTTILYYNYTILY